MTALPHYVPDNQASRATRRQWEGETALAGGTVGPRTPEPEPMGEPWDETRRRMGVIVWLLGAAAVGVVLGVIVVWPMIVGQ